MATVIDTYLATSITTSRDSTLEERRGTHHVSKLECFDNSAACEQYQAANRPAAYYYSRSRKHMILPSRLVIREEGKTICAQTRPSSCWYPLLHYCIMFGGFFVTVYAPPDSSSTMKANNNCLQHDHVLDKSGSQVLLPILSSRLVGRRTCLTSHFDCFEFQPSGGTISVGSRRRYRVTVRVLSRRSRICFFTRTVRMSRDVKSSLALFLLTAWTTNSVVSCLFLNIEYQTQFPTGGVAFLR